MSAGVTRNWSEKIIFISTGQQNLNIARAKHSGTLTGVRYKINRRKEKKNIVWCLSVILTKCFNSWDRSLTSCKPVHLGQWWGIMGILPSRGQVKHSTMPPDLSTLCNIEDIETTWIPSENKEVTGSPCYHGRRRSCHGTGLIGSVRIISWRQKVHETRWVDDRAALTGCDHLHHSRNILWLRAVSLRRDHR